jgi:predicted DNA-binding transcriptional regulator AlpA
MASVPPRRVLLSHDDLYALGISYNRVTLWRMVRDGEFPAPVKLGTGAGSRSAWHADEIEAWIKERPRTASEASGSEAT